jgi:hypothetical protein
MSAQLINDLKYLPVEKEYIPIYIYIYILKKTLFAFTKCYSSNLVFLASKTCKYYFLLMPKKSQSVKFFFFPKICFHQKKLGTFVIIIIIIVIWGVSSVKLTDFATFFGKKFLNFL